MKQRQQQQQQPPSRSRRILHQTRDGMFRILANAVMLGHVYVRTIGTTNYYDPFLIPFFYVYISYGLLGGLLFLVVEPKASSCRCNTYTVVSFTAWILMTQQQKQQQERTKETLLAIYTLLVVGFLFLVAALGLEAARNIQHEEHLNLRHKKVDDDYYDDNDQTLQIMLTTTTTRDVPDNASFAVLRSAEAYARKNQKQLQNEFEKDLLDLAGVDRKDVDVIV